MQIIETEHLTKYYGKTPVVDSLSLSVPEGSVYGFIGPNGAGKSTTMKMLLGLVKPNSGSIRLLGKSMTQQNRLSLLRQTGSLTEMNAMETQEAKIYKALDKMEAVIQHNESDISTWLPLEYDLQLTYGEENVQFSPYMQQLKAEVNDWTREKIAREKPE